MKTLQFPTVFQSAVSSSAEKAGAVSSALTSNDRQRERRISLPRTDTPTSERSCNRVYSDATAKLCSRRRGPKYRPSAAAELRLRRAEQAQMRAAGQARHHLLAAGVLGDRWAARRDA